MSLFVVNLKKPSLPALLGILEEKKKEAWLAFARRVCRQYKQ
jgi:hypothetical protein